MIFFVIRVALQALRRAGVNVPALPTLRQRQTLLEQALTPRPDRRGPRDDLDAEWRAPSAEHRADAARR